MSGSSKRRWNEKVNAQSFIESRICKDATGLHSYALAPINSKNYPNISIQPWVINEYILRFQLFFSPLFCFYCTRKAYQFSFKSSSKNQHNSHLQQWKKKRNFPKRKLILFELETDPKTIHWRILTTEYSMFILQLTSSASFLFIYFHLLLFNNSHFAWMLWEYYSIAICLNKWSSCFFSQSMHNIHCIYTLFHWL